MKRIFSPTVTAVCGGLSILIILLLVAGERFLSAGGLTLGLSMVISQLATQAESSFDATVLPAQREEFKNELTGVAGNIRKEQLAPQKIAPFLEQLQKDLGDRKLDQREVTELTRSAETLNRAAKPKSGTAPR